MIPSTVTNINNGITYTVTNIGSYAFDGCNLSSISIPNTITNIGLSAFPNLNVSKYKEYDNAYYLGNDENPYLCLIKPKDTNIASCVINDNCKVIYPNAFNNCNNLTSILIPNSVTCINSFYNCSNLHFNEYDNAYYLGNNENPYLCLIKASSTDISSCVINDNCKFISASAFRDCDNLTSITIPNSVVRIENCAFTGCENLTQVILNEGIETIGDAAFSYCGLTSITIPNSVVSIGEGFDNNYPREMGVFYCCPLTTIILGNHLTVIGNYAFHSCRYLTSITIPNSVTSIGCEAFFGCSSLATVTIPSSVTRIRVRAFEQTGPTFYCQTANPKYIQAPLDPGWSPAWVSSNGTQVYWGCNVIRTAVNNAEYGTITTSGNYAVKGDDGSLWFVSGGSATLTAKAKEGCCFVKWEDNAVESTRVVNAGGSDTYNAIFRVEPFVIGDLKFETSPYNNNVVISANSTDISGDIVIPEKVTYNNVEFTVTSIGENAFKNCIALTSVTIPNSVTSIGNSAFRYCSNLTKIAISGSVMGIGNYAFSDCSNITGICFEGSSEPNYGTSVFAGCNKLNYVRVPAEYQNANWCSIPVNNGGHDIVIESATSSASCTVPHLTEGSHCAYCGKVFVAQQVLENALGHSYDTVPVAPTCTNVGYKQLTCTRCNEIAYIDTVPAKNHSYGTPSYTWSDDGKSCTATTICQRNENHVVTEVAAITSEETIAPTCESDGTTTYTAAFENELFAMQTKVVDVPASGHSYTTNVVAPTCIEVGFTTHTCTVCNHTYNSDTVSATGHTPDRIVLENLVAATCTAAGSRDSVVYCSVCQDELFREKKSILASGHNYSNNVVAPTCTEVGYTTHTCSVCNHTYNSDTVAAKGHTEVVDASIAATCTEAGKTEGKHCSVCNVTLVEQTVVAALGHDFGKYVYNNDATTDADGTKTATCSRCGEKDTQVAEGTKLAKTPEDGTAVTESAANEVNIYAHGNKIVVENATEEIYVYNAMGALVGRDAINRVRTEINVNIPGVYIVKTGSVVKRVIVN